MSTLIAAELSDSGPEGTIWSVGTPDSAHLSAVEHTEGRLSCDELISVLASHNEHVLRCGAMTLMPRKGQLRCSANFDGARCTNPAGGTWRMTFDGWRQRAKGTYPVCDECSQRLLIALRSLVRPKAIQETKCRAAGAFIIMSPLVEIMGT